MDALQMYGQLLGATKDTENEKEPSASSHHASSEHSMDVKVNSPGLAMCNDNASNGSMEHFFTRFTQRLVFGFFQGYVKMNDLPCLGDLANVTDEFSKNTPASMDSFSESSQIDIHAILHQPVINITDSESNFRIMDRHHIFRTSKAFKNIGTYFSQLDIDASLNFLLLDSDAQLGLINHHHDSSNISKTLEDVIEFIFILLDNLNTSSTTLLGHSTKSTDEIELLPKKNSNKAHFTSDSHATDISNIVYPTNNLPFQLDDFPGKVCKIINLDAVGPAASTSNYKDSNSGPNTSFRILAFKQRKISENQTTETQKYAPINCHRKLNLENFESQFHYHRKNVNDVFVFTNCAKITVKNGPIGDVNTFAIPNQQKLMSFLYGDLEKPEFLKSIADHDDNGSDAEKVPQFDLKSSEEAHIDSSINFVVNEAYAELMSGSSCDSEAHESFQDGSNIFDLSNNLTSETYNASVNVSNGQVLGASAHFPSDWHSLIPENENGSASIESILFTTKINEVFLMNDSSTNDSYEEDLRNSVPSLCYNQEVYTPNNSPSNSSFGFMDSETQGNPSSDGFGNSIEHPDFETSNASLKYAIPNPQTLEDYLFVNVDAPKFLAFDETSDSIGNCGLDESKLSDRYLNSPYSNDETKYDTPELSIESQIGSSSGSFGENEITLTGSILYECKTELPGSDWSRGDFSSSPCDTSDYEELLGSYGLHNQEEFTDTNYTCASPTWPGKSKGQNQESLPCVPSNLTEDDYANGTLTADFSSFTTKINRVPVVNQNATSDFYEDRSRNSVSPCYLHQMECVFNTASIKDCSENYLFQGYPCSDGFGDSIEHPAFEYDSSSPTFAIPDPRTLNDYFFGNLDSPKFLTSELQNNTFEKLDSSLEDCCLGHHTEEVNPSDKTFKNQCNTDCLRNYDEKSPDTPCLVVEYQNDLLAGAFGEFEITPTVSTTYDSYTGLADSDWSSFDVTDHNDLLEYYGIDNQDQEMNYNSTSLSPTWPGKMVTASKNEVMNKNSIFNFCEKTLEDYATPSFLYQKSCVFNTNGNYGDTDISKHFGSQGTLSDEGFGDSINYPAVEIAPRSPKFAIPDPETLNEFLYGNLESPMFLASELMDMKFDNHDSQSLPGDSYDCADVVKASDEKFFDQSKDYWSGNNFSTSDKCGDNELLNSDSSNQDASVFPFDFSDPDELLERYGLTNQDQCMDDCCCTCDSLTWPGKM